MKKLFLGSLIWIMPIMGMDLPKRIVGAITGGTIGRHQSRRIVMPLNDKEGPDAGKAGSTASEKQKKRNSLHLADPAVQDVDIEKSLAEQLSQARAKYKSSQEEHDEILKGILNVSTSIKSSAKIQAAYALFDSAQKHLDTACANIKRFSSKRNFFELKSGITEILAAREMAVLAVSKLICAQTPGKFNQWCNYETCVHAGMIAFNHQVKAFFEEQEISDDMKIKGPALGLLQIMDMSLASKIAAPEPKGGGRMSVQIPSPVAEQNQRAARSRRHSVHFELSRATDIITQLREEPKKSTTPPQPVPAVQSLEEIEKGLREKLKLAEEKGRSYLRDQHDTLLKEILAVTTSFKSTSKIEAAQKLFKSADQHVDAACYNVTSFRDAKNNAGTKSALLALLDGLELADFAVGKRICAETPGKYTEWCRYETDVDAGLICLRHKVKKFFETREIPEEMKMKKL